MNERMVLIIWTVLLVVAIGGIVALYFTQSMWFVGLVAACGLGKVFFLDPYINEEK